MKNNFLKGLVLCAAICLSFSIGATKIMAASAGAVTDANNSPVGAIVPYQVITGDATDQAKFNTYNVVMPVDTASTDRKSTYVVPIVVTTPGCVNAFIAGVNGTSSSIYADLFADAALTNQIGGSYSGWYSGATGAKNIDVDVPGTYYVKFSFYNNGAAATGVSFTFSSQAFNSTMEKSLANGVWDCAYRKSANDVFWYKVVADSTGVIKFEVDGAQTDVNGQLYKLNKTTALSEELLIRSSAVFEDYDKASFAVKKGTYYVKVSGGSSDLIVAKYSFTGKSDASKSSKKKATKIKLGKTKKGVLLASDSTKKYDWYKFTVTKKKKVTITFSGTISSGEAELEVYEANGDRFGGISIYRTSTTSKASPYVARIGASSGTLPKGTYYIKVSKDSKQTSGNYSVKVK